ncbi:unnamed protein product [Schistosoma mattheei]|uniref:Uncharacterized protein n=1 Tax=Schistosoma mattheei TaxID=31246 RepID=A0A3P8G3Q9_9TREM|nr:unnamed protein product [Schistosoma mattheei]
MKSLTSSLSHVGLTSVGDRRKKVKGRQTRMWHQSIRSLTSGLSHVSRCRLLGWGPCVYRNQWLETVGDMTQKRPQWSRCIHFLSSFKP